MDRSSRWLYGIILGASLGSGSPVMAAASPLQAIKKIFSKRTEPQPATARSPHLEAVRQAGVGIGTRAMVQTYRRLNLSSDAVGDAMGRLHESGYFTRIDLDREHGALLESYRALKAEREGADSFPREVVLDVKDAMDRIERAAKTVSQKADQNSDAVAYFSTAGQAYRSLATMSADISVRDSRRFAQLAQKSFLDAAEVFTRKGTLELNSKLVQQALTVAKTYGVPEDQARIARFDELMRHALTNGEKK